MAHLMDGFRQREDARLRRIPRHDYSLANLISVNGRIVGRSLCRSDALRPFPDSQVLQH
jgi:hypothetical protein